MTDLQEQLDRIEAKVDLLLDNAGKEGPAVDVVTGEIWPDWYVDLYSIPGFKRTLDQCEAWLTTKPYEVKIRANETAAALKGSWNGKKYKDPWATFRAWVQRAPLHGAQQRQGSTAIERLAERKEQDRLKHLAAYEQRWGKG